VCAEVADVEDLWRALLLMKRVLKLSPKLEAKIFVASCTKKKLPPWRRRRKKVPPLEYRLLRIRLEMVKRLRVVNLDLETSRIRFNGS